MNNKSNLDLVRAFLQVERGVNLINTTHSLNGSVEFSGSKEFNGEHKRVRFVMDKNQVELINECNGVIEIYECYKEMEY